MSQLERRRAEVAERWAMSDGVVLVRAGSAVPVPGSDTYHPFHPHPDFAYLTAIALFFVSFTVTKHAPRSRTSFPGARRNHFLGASSM